MSGDVLDVRNVFDGRAGVDVDFVLQAGQVHGGVHVHTWRPVQVARLVPLATPYFTDRTPVLAAADAFVQPDMTRPRLLVFYGGPGVGKREVARRWLALRTDDYPDGQFHADLTAGSDGDGLVSAKLREFLLAAGVEASAIPDTQDGRAACFRSWSMGKRVAVVVDGAFTPDQVRPLTPGPGNSVVLVTAARRLRGLEVRDLVTFIDVKPLDNSAATDLLTRLVGADRVTAEPDAARELVDLCAGLPIAISVVAALLADRRYRRLTRLAGELRDEQDRLRTLSKMPKLSVKSVFNTAYRRLSPAAQRCHRAIGIHPGTGSVSDDALRAAVDLPEDVVDDAVDELLEAALLHEEPEGGRYRQHDLLRLHARGLAGTAEVTAVLSRVIDSYVGRAVCAGHAVIPERGWLAAFFDVPLGAEDRDEAMEWLRAELENLRAIVEPMVAQAYLEKLCLLAVALWPLHERGKHFADLVALTEHAIVAAANLGRPALGALLEIQLGFARLQGGRPELAYDLFQSAVEVATTAGIPTLEATAVESLGLAALALGRREEAEALLRRNLELAEAIGDSRRLALARFHLAKAIGPDAAVPLLDAALAGFLGLESADEYNAAKTRWWLGQKLLEDTRFADARTYLDEALAGMQAGRMVYDQARILETLGDLASATADAAAAVWFRESLAITESCGFTRDAERVREKLVALGELGDGDAVNRGSEGD